MAHRRFNIRGNVAYGRQSIGASIDSVIDCVIENNTFVQAVDNQALVANQGRNANVQSPKILVGGAFNSNIQVRNNIACGVPANITGEVTSTNNLVRNPTNGDIYTDIFANIKTTSGTEASPIPNAWTVIPGGLIETMAVGAVDMSAAGNGGAAGPPPPPHIARINNTCLCGGSLMPVTLERAGNTYVCTLSNKGLRVEFDGMEILKHWPANESPVEPPINPPVDPVDPLPEPEPQPPTTPPSAGPKIGKATLDPGTGAVILEGVTMPGDCLMLINYSAQPLGSDWFEQTVRQGNPPAFTTFPITRGSNTGSLDRSKVRPGPAFIHIMVKAGGKYSTDLVLPFNQP